MCLFKKNVAIAMKNPACRNDSVNSRHPVNTGISALPRRKAVITHQIRNCRSAFLKNLKKRAESESRYPQVHE